MIVYVEKLDKATQKFEKILTITNVTSVTQCEESHCVSWRDSNDCYHMCYFDFSNFKIHVWSN